MELIGAEGFRIGFDLPLEAVSDWRGPEGGDVLCVTHGHPDHCGLLLRLQALDLPRVSFDLVASDSVVDHFQGLWSGEKRALHPVEAGEAIEVDGVRISAFKWEHMPLVPPETGRALHYVMNLVRHPVQLAQVVTDGIGLPLAGPMLGYMVEMPEGMKVLNYAEGLHRLTERGEVESVVERLQPDILLSAVEPEDLKAVERWVELIDAAHVFLYEAHRPWRESFELEELDLDRFASRLDERMPSSEVIALTDPGTERSVE